MKVYIIPWLYESEQQSEEYQLDAIPSIGDEVILGFHYWKVFRVIHNLRLNTVVIHVSRRNS